MRKQPTTQPQPQLPAPPPPPPEYREPDTEPSKTEPQRGAEWVDFYL